MGRAPCCDKANVKRGPWSPEEDIKLKEFIEKYGTGGNWIALPQKAGLKRCGKSCRLRWLNYLRPNIKHGEFSDDEDRVICTLYSSIGSRWSIIASHLPGRTDNDIKNYWNTKLKKKLMGIAPSQRKQHQNSRQQQQQQHQHFLSPLPQAGGAPPAPAPTSPFPPHISFSSNPAKPITGSPLFIDGGFLLPSDVFSSVAGVGPDDGGQGIQQDGAASDGTGTVLVFGGNHPSCSPSRELDYGVYGSTSTAGLGFGHQVGTETLMYSGSGCGTGFVENAKLRFHGDVAGGGDPASSCEVGRGCNPTEGIWNSTSLEYGYEEIKQLVSSHSANPSACSNRFFFTDDAGGGGGGTMVRGGVKSEGRAVYRS